MTVVGAGQTPRQEAVAGLVLAGGRARRMDGIDKGLIEIAGRPMIEHVLDRLRPQVGQLLINANRNPEIYQSYGYPVVADTLDGFLGPLAGVATALRRLECPFLLTVPCDAPLLADDLALRMLETLIAERADAAVAHDGQRLQPVFLLLRKSLAAGLERYLVGGGRKIELDISGDDLVTILDVAGRAVRKIVQVMPLEDGNQLRPKPGLELGAPEVRVYPDRTRLADNGVSARELGESLDAFNDGLRVAEVTIGNNRMDLMLRGPQKNVTETQGIASLPIVTGQGFINDAIAFYPVGPNWGVILSPGPNNTFGGLATGGDDQVVIARY